MMNNSGPDRGLASKAPHRASLPAERAGFALIEVLVAILIFSIGILGVIGLQATVIKQISDAKYRIDAANLADQLIGQMWAEDHLTTTLITKYASSGSTSGAGYLAWKAVVADRLPGVADHLPSVTIEANSSDASESTVTLIVYWQVPGATNVNNYTTVSRIR
jgi:type IV pilus assembly protein PilV